MSAFAEQIRNAIYTKLNVSSVTTTWATGGVHYKVAPPDAAQPFRLVVFDRVPGTVEYALGNNLVGERDLWLIKAIVEQDSSAAYEPTFLAETILTACNNAIGGTLSPTIGTVSMARRKSDMPPIITDQGDRQIWQLGYFLEVYVG